MTATVMTLKAWHLPEITVGWLIIVPFNYLKVRMVLWFKKTLGRGGLAGRLDWLFVHYWVRVSSIGISKGRSHQC